MDRITIHAVVKQTGEEAPEIFSAFGDEYGSLWFAKTDDLPARLSEGVYRFMVGDELGTGDMTNKVVHVTSNGSQVASFDAFVDDTMSIQVHAFDVVGDACDINGTISISLTLNV